MHLNQIFNFIGFKIKISLFKHLFSMLYILPKQCFLEILSNVAQLLIEHPKFVILFGFCTFDEIT